MNPSIKKLTEIAAKPARTIIGLMSGTSLDGLDIALCTIRGHGLDTDVLVNRFTTVSYDEKTRSALRKIVSVEQVPLAGVCSRHTWLGRLHAEMVSNMLREWGIHPEEVDCIASHGQTIYHLPSRDQANRKQTVNSTLQIGDGDHIAAITGILTISDFRQKHTAAGGEGAPMAGLVDEMLFRDKNEMRILLNIGGIGNFTCLPPYGNIPEKVFTSDTGPGNTLVDRYCRRLFQKPFDKDGNIAASGSVYEPLLRSLLADSWFAIGTAKTGGPEYFNPGWVEKKADEAGIPLETLSPEDLIRTLTELTARSITKAIERHCTGVMNATVYVSGGGTLNRFLMKRIQHYLPDMEIKESSELGIHPDAKEAVIFAVLANEMLAGEGFPFRANEGNLQKVNFGKISFPV